MRNDSFNTVQATIVRTLNDRTRPHSCYRGHLVRQQWGQLTPFLTFPTARVAVVLTYARATRAEVAQAARATEVLKGTYGLSVYTLGSVAVLADPELELGRLVLYVGERSLERLYADQMAWTNTVIEQARLKGLDYLL